MHARQRECALECIPLMVRIVDSVRTIVHPIPSHGATLDQPSAPPFLPLSPRLQSSPPSQFFSRATKKESSRECVFDAHCPFAGASSSVDKSHRRLPRAALYRRGSIARLSYALCFARARHGDPHARLEMNSRPASNKRTKGEGRELGGLPGG